MARAHRSDLLPFVDQLVALVEKSDTPEMTLRDAVNPRYFAANASVRSSHGSSAG